VSSADSIVDLQKKSARELYQIHIYIYIYNFVAALDIINCHTILYLLWVPIEKKKTYTLPLHILLGEESSGKHSGYLHIKYIRRC
jgi:hypothetical protein